MDSSGNEASPSAPQSSLLSGAGLGLREEEEKKKVRVRRESIQAVLEQCQRALELLKSGDLEVVEEEGVTEDAEYKDECGEKVIPSPPPSSVGDGDEGDDELCKLMKSTFESQYFLDKLGSIDLLRNNANEGSSWDVVTMTDLWDDKIVVGESESDQDCYILIKQEDIVDGLACYMAGYLLSLEQTKDLTPKQLQRALKKTFAVKKEKGKFRKAWDGSKVVYNVASWGTTAIGIYQNPAIVSAASAAFWTSCRAIAKLF